MRLSGSSIRPPLCRLGIPFHPLLVHLSTIRPRLVYLTLNRVYHWNLPFLSYLAMAFDTVFNKEKKKRKVFVENSTTSY
nr:MAG TPA: hypothetical protein [Caudoviricetes sp.]